MQTPHSHPPADPNAQGVGARVLRKEDARHLHGKGNFVADMSLPELCEVAFLRSPLAHARIVSARRPATGSERVVLREDMADALDIVADSTLPTYQSSAQPPLAAGRLAQGRQGGVGHVSAHRPRPRAARRSLGRPPVGCPGVRQQRRATSQGSGGLMSAARLPLPCTRRVARGARADPRGLPLQGFLLSKGEGIVAQVDGSCCAGARVALPPCGCRPGRPAMASGSARAPGSPPSRCRWSAPHRQRR